MDGERHERGHGDSGRCELVDTCPSGGGAPWSCCLTGADDCLLLVTNQHARHSGKPEAEGGMNDGHNGEGPGFVAIFKRDAQTGRLTRANWKAEVPQCLCVAA